MIPYSHRHPTPSKIRVQFSPVADILDMKISNRLFQQTRTRPRRGLSGIAAIVEVAVDANANIVGDGHIVHIHPRDSSADGRGAHRDGRCVRRAGGKSDVGAAAAPNSGPHRSNVVGVGTGKQRRKLNGRIAERVRDEHLSAIRGSGVQPIPRVLKEESGAAACGSDDSGDSRGGRTAKNPNGLVVVVLAGIDIKDQLRLGLLPRNQSQRRHH